LSLAAKLIIIFKCQIVVSFYSGSIIESESRFKIQGCLLELL